MKVNVFSIVGSIFILFILPISYARKNEPNPEDIYVQHFGNNAQNYTSWKAIERLLTSENKTKFKELCIQAHKLAGYGDVSIKTVFSKPARLIFSEDHQEYESRKIDVVTYYAENDDSQNFPYHYLTEGTHKDCVFYLDIVKDSNEEEFRVRKEVCGIKF